MTARHIFSVGALLALVPQAGAAVSLAVVGVYDENVTATNTIDAEAPGNSTALAAFRTAVAGAFSTSTGGVINFETGSSSTNESTFNVTYGGSKTFAITSFSNTATAGSSGANVTTFGGLSTVSGTRGLISYAGDTSVWTLSLGTINVSEAITSMGFTLLNRNINGQNVTVKWFVDGSTASPSSTQTDAIATATGTAGTDDTFFSYTASPGSKITSVQVTFGGTGDSRLGIDDIGFITSPVPEASSATFLGAAMSALLMRRKRTAR